MKNDVHELALEMAIELDKKILKSYPFKIGQKVKTRDGFRECKIRKIENGIAQVQIGDDKCCLYSYNFENLIPIICLKREEIREELKRICNLDDVGWIHEDIAKLIERV